MSTIHVDLDGEAAGEHPLVPSVSIENLVRQRAAALERYHRAIELLQETNEIAQRLILEPSVSARSS